MREGG
jgi:pre-mRNA-splicing factor CWC26